MGDGNPWWAHTGKGWESSRCDCYSFKTNSLVTRPINKLYPIECMNESHKLKDIALT